MSDIVDRLSDLLPDTWRLLLESAPRGPQGRQPDALLTVTSPAGASSTFVIEAETSSRMSTRVLVDIASQRAAQAQLPGIIATDYAHPTLRAACLDAGLSYLDTTGWTYLRDDRMGLFVTAQGALRAPRPPRAASMGRLDGPGASQVIQTLFDASLPVGVRDLAAAADVSPGTAAKVLPALAKAGVVERDHAGRVISCNRSGLLSRWTEDYDFARSNRDVAWLLAPRGPEWVMTELLNMSVHEQGLDLTSRFAATGSLAARRLLPRDTLSVIPLALVSLYSAKPGALAERLRLRPATKSTANVVLARPRDVALLDARPVFDGYLRLAPRARVLADLLTLEGRFVDEAEQLLESIEPGLQLDRAR